MDVETAFKTLGAPVGASEEVLAACYRRAVKRSHPDHGGSSTHFLRVQAAWEQLRGRPQAPDALTKSRPGTAPAEDEAEVLQPPDRVPRIKARISSTRVACEAGLMGVIVGGIAEPPAGAVINLMWLAGMACLAIVLAHRSVAALVAGVTLMSLGTFRLAPSWTEAAQAAGFIVAALALGIGHIRPRR